MKKWHWSMVKNDSVQMIFKASLVISAVWREYLAVTINQNGLGLIGSQCFVEKLVRRIKV
jgi:hypothetical protein